MKKKILIIMNSLGGGGAEKVLITYLQNFDFSRFEVDLCLINKVGVFIDQIPEKVRLIALYENPNSLAAKVDYGFDLKFGIKSLERRRIRSKISKRYDAIISWCEGRALKFHSYVTNRSDNNISWVHIDLYANHYTVSKYFTEQHELSAYAAMQNIVFVSNDAKCQFEKLFPSLHSTPKHVILNPIDQIFISKFRKEHSEEQKIKIVCVGGLRKQKAFDRVIRLASRLKQDGLGFVIEIIGEGSCRTELEELIRDYNVQDFVQLKGFLNPPYEAMSDADIFLSTSLTEGMPLVQLEALCLGIPVVATKCTGPLELLGNSEYGMLVDQDDESIYEGVKRLITDKELRLHYTKKGLERIHDFDAEAILNKLYNLALK